MSARKTFLHLAGKAGLVLGAIFGWMVHVYPYEDSLDKIFAMHHHVDG